MAFNRRKLGALLGALLVTVAVAGTAGASPQSTPGVTKKQIVIGGTFPFSGPAALYKTIPVAEAAYYAYVNAKGGVFHRKIKDITVDDQYDPSQTGPATTKLVDVDKPRRPLPWCASHFPTTPGRATGWCCADLNPSSAPRAPATSRTSSAGPMPPHWSTCTFAV